MGKYSEEFTLEEKRTVINMGKEEDPHFLVSLTVSRCYRLMLLRDYVSIKATRLVPFPAVPVLLLFTRIKLWEDLGLQASHCLQGTKRCPGLTMHKKALGTVVSPPQLKSCRESTEATTKVCPSWLCACPGQRASCADKAITAREQEGALGRSDWLYLGNSPRRPPESSLGARMSQ